MHTTLCVHVCISPFMRLYRYTGSQGEDSRGDMGETCSNRRSKAESVLRASSGNAWEDKRVYRGDLKAAER